MTFDHANSRPQRLAGPGGGPGFDLIHNVPGVRARFLAGQAQGYEAVAKSRLRRNGKPNGTEDLKARAAGEELAARMFRVLGPEWLILHDIPISAFGNTIPHLLVGPAGVFTVDTKNDLGKKVFLHGPDTPVRKKHANGYVAEGISGADLARTVLTVAVGERVEVHPILLLVDAAEVVIVEPVGRVIVATNRRDIESLLELPHVLTKAQIDRIGAAARNPYTWCDTTPVSADQPYIPAHVTHGLWPSVTPADMDLSEDIRTDFHRRSHRSTAWGFRVAIAASVLGVVLSALGSGDSKPLSHDPDPPRETGGHHLPARPETGK